MPKGTKGEKRPTHVLNNAGESDLSTVSVPSLIDLRRALMAKLILVTDELRKRDENILELTKDLQNSDGPRQVLTEAAHRNSALNTLLRSEFEWAARERE